MVGAGEYIDLKYVSQPGGTKLIDIDALLSSSSLVYIGLLAEPRFGNTNTDWSSGGQAKFDMKCRLKPNSYMQYTARDDLTAQYYNDTGAALRVSKDENETLESFTIDNYLAVETILNITHVSRDTGQKRTVESIPVRDYYNLRTKIWTGSMKGIYVAIHPLLLNTGSIYEPKERYTRMSLVPGSRVWEPLLIGGEVLIKGNYGKGHLNERGGSAVEREEIPLPCLIGAGTYTITVRKIRLLSNLMNPSTHVFNEVMNNENQFNDNDWSTVSVITYTIDPILTNDNNNLDTALIAELPYSSTKYYNGQYPADSDVTFALNPYSFAQDWSPGDSVRYAVVYLMLSSLQNDNEIVNPTNCFNWYELRQPSSKQKAVYDDARILIPQQYITSVTKSSDGVGTTFSFTAGYPFFIYAGRQYPTTATTLTIKMPAGSRALQFVTLLYRVVANDGGGYTVDPDCPSAIEMHTGIGVENGLKRDCVTIRPFMVEEHLTEVTFKIVQWSGSNPLYVKIERQIVSTTPITATGLIVEFSLTTPGASEVIMTSSTRLPFGTETTKQYEVAFPLSPDNHERGNKYNVQVTILKSETTGGTILQTYAITTPTLEIGDKNIIEEVSITPLAGQKTVSFIVSGLKMPYVSESTKFWYTLTAYREFIDDEYEFSEQRSETASTPNQFTKWELDPKTLEDGTKHIIVFEVWDHADADVLNEYPLASHTVEYNIDLGKLENIVIEETYDGADKITDDGKAKTTWSFAATTTLPIQSEHVHKWTAELTDLTVPEPVPYTWEFEETGSTLNVTDTTVKLMSIGQYRMTLKVADAADASIALATTREGTIGGVKIEGKLDNGIQSLHLSSPFKEPHSTNAEYRLLKDGFAGAVESPWEMRNETVVGSMSAGSPVWMVHPRDLSFRVLVTASDTNIIDALKDLISLLTVDPRSPIDLVLWTSDGAQQLTISGYPEVGTPVIEMRESTGAIVAITLKCPRYAWRGNTVKATPKASKYTISLTGNLPPAFDIIIRPAGEPLRLTKITFRREGGTQVVPISLKINDLSNHSTLRLHYDPIMQDLGIFARYNVKGGGQQSSIIPTPISRCKLAKSPVWLVKNDDNTIEQETSAFYILDAKSDLGQLNLTPGATNIIETDGIIEEVTITPYYAHWW